MAYERTLRPGDNLLILRKAYVGDTYILEAGEYELPADLLIHANDVTIRAIGKVIVFGGEIRAAEGVTGLSVSGVSVDRGSGDETRSIPVKDLRLDPPLETTTSVDARPDPSATRANEAKAIADEAGVHRRKTLADLRQYEQDHELPADERRVDDEAWVELRDAANRAVNLVEAAKANHAAAKDAENPDLKG